MRRRLKPNGTEPTESAELKEATRSTEVQEVRQVTEVTEFTEVTEVTNDTKRRTVTLLTLPPELRNLIFEYTLPHDRQLFDFVHGIYIPVPTVLQANRQIRAECLGPYYSSTEFEFITYYRCTRLFRLWAKNLDPKARTYLFKNNNRVNIRILFDSSHPEYAKIRHLLGGVGVCKRRPDRWFIAADEYFVGAPTAQDYNFVACRRVEKEGIAKAAEQGEASEDEIDGLSREIVKGQKTMTSELRRAMGRVSEVFGA